RSQSFVDSLLRYYAAGFTALHLLYALSLGGEHPCGGCVGTWGRRRIGAENSHRHQPFPGEPASHLDHCHLPISNAGRLFERLSEAEGHAASSASVDRRSENLVKNPTYCLGMVEDRRWRMIDSNFQSSIRLASLRVRIELPAPHRHGSNERGTR